MSSAFRFTGIFILGLAAIVAAFSFSGGGKAQAAGATIDCSIPQAVECDIYHPDGIANVTVKVNFGGDIGVVEVVDENFVCQQNVSVSWDPIVPNYDIEVTPCSGYGLQGEGGDVRQITMGLILLTHSGGSDLQPGGGLRAR